MAPQFIEWHHLSFNLKASKQTHEFGVMIWLHDPAEPKYTVVVANGWDPDIVLE
jgi:hypothetical protein